MTLVLLAGIALAAQAELPEGLQERVRIESAAGTTLVLLDETVLYYGGGKKAGVALQSSEDRERTYLTVLVDEVEAVRLGVFSLEKPVEFPPTEVTADGFLQTQRRMQDGKPWIHVHFRSPEGLTFGVYDGPGTAATVSKDSFVGSRKSFAVRVDNEIVFRSPIGADAPAATLSEGAVALLTSRYKASGQWTLQALVLMALGESFPPSASELLLLGLSAKDKRLRAYAVEVLARATPATLAAAATPEIVENLALTQLSEKNPYYSGRVAEVLRRILPWAGKDLAGAWRKAKVAYAPVGWEQPPRPPKARAPDGPGQTVAERLVTRALDLNDTGLDVAICIDTTGSMQPTINAARAALGDIVSILRGVAPQFRLGLVHYRDVVDFKEGAELLVPLTAAVDPVQKFLATLKAEGGGDFPENVERGMMYALQPGRMGWKRNTNKLLVIVGDAPPHDKDLETCITLARTAHETPFGGKMVPTGPAPLPKDATRPFIVSTIGVGIGGQVSPDTEDAFKKIAEAGGGSYGVFAAGAAAGGADGEANAIVEHLLTLSFGAEWKKPLAAFLAIYTDYRQQAFFK